MIYIYDNSFEGFLSCVFESYSKKHSPADIRPKSKTQQELFIEKYIIHTDDQKAERVWRALQNKLSPGKKQLLYYAFLSNEDGIEIRIFRFIKRLFNSSLNIETDYGDEDVLYLTQTAQKVQREAMRMLQFVRFQQTKEGIYFCGIEARYDVIPLITTHFKNRFANQQWLLYDLKRDYGAWHSSGNIEEVVISHKQFDKLKGQVKQQHLDETENDYQKLWKSYFTHINIKERKNLRLQRQHLPKRFRKYLPEMNG